MLRWMQLALNELGFQIKCIYNRSLIISSYDLLLTTNTKIPGRTIRKVMEWGRGAGGGWEKNFRAAGIFFRCRIPCINFFRPLGLIGVHEFFFFFFSFNFPCADIFLYSRRSEQPSSKQGLDRRLFFSVLPLLRIMKRVTGVTQQQPPPQKLFKSMPWFTPKNTENTLKASLLYLFVRKRKKNKWSDI